MGFSMPVAKWNDRYIRLGVEYYIAGRQAALLQHMVAANLLHHALEMTLKAPFREFMAPGQLANQFGHDLPKLWSEFKFHANDARLDRYDQLVDQLNPWDEFRYPDFEKTSTLMLEVSRSSIPYQPLKGKTNYVVCLEDFDELFELLVEVMHIGRRWLWIVIGKAADAYRLKNFHVILEGLD
jgi:hypothetical protein